MYWEQEWSTLIYVITVSLVLFFLPVGNERFNRAVPESLYLARPYALEHIVSCLTTAFFIAGAVCSFTALPLFAGIYKMDAGLSPASAFLYSGPELSLLNMPVTRSTMGTKKTIVFVLLVVVIATTAGVLVGSLF